jgi:D-arabinose 1-dehydrogenase-like Zn-dependent alcohol dehydrogenase
MSSGIAAWQLGTGVEKDSAYRCSLARRQRQRRSGVFERACRGVMALAAAGKIQHKITPVRFDQINETIERLRDGSVVGRAVMMF